MVRTVRYHGPRLGPDKDYQGSGGTDAARWRRLDGKRAGTKQKKSRGKDS